MLVGAEEESSGASVPAAAVPAPDSLPGMPDCFLDVPFASLPVAARYTNDSLMAEAPPSWGTTEAERIQPAIFAHEDTTSTHDPASNSCRALRSLPMLSDSWVPRKELWQVRPVPVPVFRHADAPAPVILPPLTGAVLLGHGGLRARNTLWRSNH